MRSGQQLSGRGNSAPGERLLTDSRCARRIRPRPIDIHQYQGGQGSGPAFRGGGHPGRCDRSGRRPSIGQGMKVSLDLLGEEVRSTDEVETALAGYVACLDGIAANAIDGNISIKLTQLGLALDPDLARSTLDRLAVSAAASRPDRHHRHGGLDLHRRQRSKSTQLPSRPTATSASPCRRTCAARRTISSG